MDRLTARRRRGQADGQNVSRFMRDLLYGYLRGLTETTVARMAGILYIKAETC